MATTTSDADLMTLCKAIAAGDAGEVSRLLDARPQLTRAALKQGATREAAQEFNLFGRYLYAGHTALHVAAGFYRVDMVRDLIARGADVRARNRRGAEPLHAAAVGNPDADDWNPEAQAVTIGVLIAAGANPDAIDKGGVTPLHRVVRTRCAAAVKALLAGGADPLRTNNSGSTPMALATQTTGRGGSGSPQARAEQAIIIALLDVPCATR